jgi:hypothetical protein
LHQFSLTYALETDWPWRRSLRTLQLGVKGKWHFRAKAQSTAKRKTRCADGSDQKLRDYIAALR